jgi:hypothetical protein
MGPVLYPCPPDVHQIDRIARHVFDQLDEDERHEFFAGLREVWPDGPLDDDQAIGRAMFNMLGYLADWQISIQLAQHPDFAPDVEPIDDDPAHYFTYEELGAALGL